ncbi:hypothetical protein Tco_0296125 [Tanacetum coccineum]
MTRGYGVGGRLVCAVKDGSMMAVIGVSIREVASVCCPKISSYKVSWFGFSMLETGKPMLQTSSVVDLQDLRTSSSDFEPSTFAPFNFYCHNLRLLMMKYEGLLEL